MDGGLRSAEDVANVTLEVGGQLLRLADIATVRAGYEDPPSLTIRHNGVPVLAIGVTMQPNGNVLDFGRALEQRLAQVRQELPAGVEIQQYADQPRVVAESVWEFERSFLEALAIVLAVSFLFLGWRTGIVVAASVPLVLGLVAAVMYAAGWNLDRISLGALIIALGLLVDDAIIAVEMMVVKLEQGWDRMRAATYVYTSTAFPMLTGTLVTAAGFMPVGFAKSIAGQYAGGIFWVVGVALILSWFVAVVFTPYLGLLLLPKNLAAGTHHDVYDRPVYHRLRRIVDWAVQHRKWVLALTVLAFAIAGAGMLQVQQQFFPTASRPELLVELRLREGASFAATERQVKLLEARLAKDPDVEFFTAYTGAGTPLFYLSILPELPNPGFAQFVVKTAGIEQRERVRARLMELFDKDEALPDVKARVHAPGVRPAGGLPGPVPRHRARQGPGARDRLPRARHGAPELAGARHAAGLERAGPLGAGPCRPGQGTAAGPVHRRHPGPGADDAGRRAGHADPPRRRTRRRGRARHARGAQEHWSTRRPAGLHARRRQRAAVSAGPHRAGLRRAGAVATQSRHGAHGAQRRCRWRAGPLRHGADPAVAAAHHRQPAAGLPHRGRRRDRGERQGQRGAVRGVPGDVRGDADAADDPAAELLARCSWCS